MLVITETVKLQVQGAARRTVALLNSIAFSEATFEAAFLPRLDPLAPFDYIWHLELPEGQNDCDFADRPTLRCRCFVRAP